ncbi:hypothetical protein GQ600_16746 [Phytophthora cactorum]|nr:hypothetical protein GQ600_16746 [Phytophthora cactorum]
MTKILKARLRTSFRARDSALKSSRHNVLNGTNQFCTAHPSQRALLTVESELNADVLDNSGRPPTFEAIVTDAEVPLVALHSRELVNNSDSDDSRVPPTAPADDTDNEYEEKPESDVHVAKCLNLDDVVIDAGRQLLGLIQKRSQEAFADDSKPGFSSSVDSHSLSLKVPNEADPRFEKLKITSQNATHTESRKEAKQLVQEICNANQCRQSVEVGIQLRICVRVFIQLRFQDHGAQEATYREMSKFGERLSRGSPGYEATIWRSISKAGAISEDQIQVMAKITHHGDLGGCAGCCRVGGRTCMNMLDIPKVWKSMRS